MITGWWRWWWLYRMVKAGRQRSRPSTVLSGAAAPNRWYSFKIGRNVYGRAPLRTPRVSHSILWQRRDKTCPPVHVCSPRTFGSISSVPYSRRSDATSTDRQAQPSPNDKSPRHLFDWYNWHSRCFSRNDVTEYEYDSASRARQNTREQLEEKRRGGTGREIGVGRSMRTEYCRRFLSALHLGGAWIIGRAAAAGRRPGCHGYHDAVEERCCHVEPAVVKQVTS